MRYPISLSLFVVLAQSFLIGTAAGDEPKGDDPKDSVKARTAKLIAIYREHAASYQMQLGPQATELALQVEPVFVWENRARVGTPRLQTGGVFVWTLEGRAEVIGTVFSQTVGDKEVVWSFETGTQGPYIESGINAPYRFSSEGTIELPAE